MDASFLNFHKEEDFSSYFLDPDYDSQGYDGPNSDGSIRYDWEWDNEEQELNGDVGLIPVSSQTTDFFPLSTSPPIKEDYNKIMNEWHHLVNLDVTDDLAIDVGITSIPPEELIAADGFDITKYVDQPDPPKPRGGKRIDMARRMYVIDDGEDEEDEEDEMLECESKSKVKNEEDDEDDDISIDVETVETHVSHPVLQAGDLNSLLEQFEATETTNLVIQQSHSLTDEDIFESTPKVEVMNTAAEEISEDIDIKNFVYMSPRKILPISPIKSPVKKVSVDIHNKKETPNSSPSRELKFQPPSSVPTNETLPRDDSFATPTKDQNKNRQILDSLPPELIDRIRQSSKRKPVPVIAPIVPAKKRLSMPQVKENTIVHLDHDYCSNTPRKDSGFSSCEEDDRSILRSQPTVKNADGKLMVSLLKTNTIKKKLNLEEYKKRLKFKSHNSSGNNSPAPEEDENARRLKHQEMLMKMAQEIITQQQVKSEENNDEIKKEEKDIKPIEVPSNIVRKTLVSVGTNTEESWGHLEQILQNTRIKISPNSLISSIVEHLPKVKPVIVKQVEHGEDKTIVYLDKEREKPKMVSVHVQTIHSSTRRRRSSSSSSSRSSDSSCSRWSRESSSSRTPSPIRRRNKEQMKEVEERRVIYVGRISDYVTREDLRRRFGKFGAITNVSVHFRRRADNYGFVTFVHKEDAYEAVERGNDDPDLPQYDLSFGGRRLFCQTTYADLDNVKDDPGYWSPITGTVVPQSDNSFDVLLREAQAKLRNRQL